MGGGGTNAVKLYKKVEDDEKIHYLHFCSLYPSVNKYCKYPLKHPRIINKVLFYLLKSYIPPRNLYFPVLPQKINGKLVFALCRNCGEEGRQLRCTCSNEDRCITGTWCIPEIVRVVQVGYEIVKMYEVYHFDSVSSPGDPDNDLFGGYIDLFLKIKQESSGWPAYIQTEEEAFQYISNYAARENVKLNSEAITKNAAMRSIAKLLLNSFWGKFGQRLNMPQTSFSRN